jgi:late competence protein required for DNA uptake (superfamily II DNA/RNA helicase)
MNTNKHKSVQSREAVSTPAARTTSKRVKSSKLRETSLESAAMAAKTAPAIVETETRRLVCPTCKSDRWAEIHSSKTDPTGFTLYCRRCEEGCVTPLVS